ncbi:MAG TPA: hypothetical protein VFU43_10110 [Streptosporangiaceae bacterium]|nr:hypothetical protein [Streptosporangiaceae bacterium]
MFAIDFFQGKPFNIATLILGLVGIGGTLLGVFLARATLFPPRKQLNILIKHPTSLLSDAFASISGVEVKHQDQPLGNPYIAEMLIEVTGRHDISSVDFDQDRPLKISMGSAALVEVLKVSMQPSSMTVPSCVVGGPAMLNVGPDLLKRQSKIEIQMLVDGKPDIQCDAPLINVGIQVHRGMSPQQRQTSERRARRIIVGGLCATAVLSLSLAGYSAYVLDQSLNGYLDRTFAGTVAIRGEGGAKGADLTITGAGFSKSASLLLTLHCETLPPIPTFLGKTNSRGEFIMTKHVDRLPERTSCGVIVIQSEPKAGVAAASTQID